MSLNCHLIKYKNIQQGGFIKDRIFESILEQKATIEDVLCALDAAGTKIVFIVENKSSNKLLGIFTDGDIRRAFLNGAMRDSIAIDHMKREFVHGRANNTKETNLLLVNDSIRDLPILDSKGCIVDFLSKNDISGLPVARPTLTGNEWKYVKECLDTGWISSQGSFVKKFEDDFAHFLKVPYAVSCSNGTTALHLAMLALGIGPGDEVIVPNITFAASANTVIHTGATPVFVDICPDHWTLDADQLKSLITKKTKAIMPVHLYGHPCDLDQIISIADEHNLYVVEDCAESFGAEYKGEQTGTFGHISCFSFFSNKVITTGEGGMCVTKDPVLNDRMRILRDHGMSKVKRYWHEIVGYNYRLTNIQAAMGLAQLEQAEVFLANRRLTARRYSERLKDLPGVTLPIEMSWAKNIYWLYSILIDENQVGLPKDVIMNALAREGIETRPFFYPLSQQPAFIAYSNGAYPVSENISKQGINLPTSNDTTLEEVERVSNALAKLFSDKFRRAYASLLS